MQQLNFKHIERRMIVRERIQRADGSIHYREYLKQERLGKGGFAECFVVERISDKKKYALKIISKKLLEKPKARQKMLSEIKLHSRAKHKSICELERAFEDDDNVYMLLQICTNGNMFELIRRRKKLTIPETQYFAYQLIDALCYLHNREIVHRDVKLGNLLIDSKMNLKLADFGLTTKLQFKGDRKHTVCGTPNYIAPEIIMASMGMGASGHSYEVDVWSTGVIMYLMLIGRAPFETSKVEHTYQRISKGQFDFPDSFKGQQANQAKDLIRRILVVDPSKRYTFEEILAHPFMNPKCGIPKQIPQICMTTAPKFGVFQKYSQQSVKQSARNASIMTLRSSVELSLNDDFDDSGEAKNPDTVNQSTGLSKSRSKDVKGLLRNVFSTTSLNKSLQKLDHLSRTSSPSSRNLVRGTQMNNSYHSRLNTSGSRESSLIGNLSMRQSRLNTEPEGSQMFEKKKVLTYVYIVQYKQETVWNYQLNNGYIGTYESGYKLLYNKQDNLYFEIEGDTIKTLARKDEVANEKLNNRKQFLKNYGNSSLQCEPFISKSRLVYITNIYKVAKQNLILFKLSNGLIQAHDYEKNLFLVMASEDLIMLELKEGVEVSKHVEKKTNYAKCPAAMIKIYLQVKRIMTKINNR